MHALVNPSTTRVCSSAASNNCFPACSLPPYNSRKTVLLLSRKDGSAKNGGRNINNMDELINATETVLRARNQGGVLRVSHVYGGEPRMA
jgi:hypothetical protein